MKNVLCWIELDEEGLPTSASLETLEEAAEVARAWGGQLRAAVLAGRVSAEESATWGDILGCHGAQVGLVASHPKLEAYSTEGFCAVLAQIVKSGDFGGCFGPASPNGNDLLPRLAARLNAELVSDCLRFVALPGGGLRLTRPIYGDRLHTVYQVEATSGRVLASLRPGVRGLSPLKKFSPAEIWPVPVGDNDLSGIRTSSLGSVPPDPRTVDLVEAERIVAIGLGLPREAGLKLSSELAECLGAAVGGTRPVVDKGWLPFARQIGTTGRSVAPRLYIALGISGASQHTGGLRGARNIITINRDRSAPMMSISDLAIVGDAAEIVPILLEKLLARRKKALVAIPAEVEEAGKPMVYVRSY